MEKLLASSFVVSACCGTVTPGIEQQAEGGNPSGGTSTHCTKCIGFENQAPVQSLNTASQSNCSAMPGAAKSWPLRKECQDFDGRDAKGDDRLK